MSHRILSLSCIQQSVIVLFLSFSLYRKEFAGSDVICLLLFAFRKYTIFYRESKRTRFWNRMAPSAKFIRTTQKLSIIVFWSLQILAHIVGIALLVSTGLWVTNFFGGFDWGKSPGTFGYHAFFGVLGPVVVCGEGNCINWYTFWRMK